ncbi:hypothetical protein L5515_006174 [Caenorhabditis briggsae]|uniref:glucuronosyltransferase n=2 Tax=Caenorhabditis briggsae TaxID=6238 RepID=A0AAE9F1Y0_CAEBR|nr:hypothetical protein L5515_006174 [Caenorhabditis briggsae]
MIIKHACFVLFLLLVGYGNSSKILIHNPIFGFSHVKFISKLADIIADHGHDVTLFQPYHLALKNLDGLVKNQNVEILNYYPSHYDELLKKETQTFPMFWDSHLIGNPVLRAFMLAPVLGGEFKKTAMEVLSDKNLINELKSKKFDVVMAETWELSGIYLAHLLDIPCIPMMSTVRYPIFNQIFGQPSFVGHVPQMGSVGAPEAGFFDRLNDVFETFWGTIAQERLNSYQNQFIEEAIGRPVPYWKDLVKQSPIYITNSNSYLDYAVPTTATIVHVGGITMDLKKMKNVGPLSEEYEEILQERESTVLISFGSVIRSFEMPENFKAGLIKMFESLPDVTFIWKYEKDDAEFEKRLPKNVNLKKWVPQPALLADHRVKVFVTHGGLGSIMEVAYTGKPAIVVPIFGDQNHNANMLARHGGALAYSKYDLPDGKKLAGVIKEMISNQKYKQNAETLFHVLSNQPIDPTHNFLTHLDFAIKFPNLRSQVPEINQVGLIAHYYLDVVLFLCILGIAFAYLSFKLVKRILRRFAGEKTKTD